MIEKIKTVLIVLILGLIIWNVYQQNRNNKKLEEIRNMKVQLDSIILYEQQYQLEIKKTQDSVRESRKLSLEIYNKIKLEATKSYERYQTTSVYFDSLTSDIGILPEL